MGVLESIDQKSFLGTDFLTWLWYRAETGQARFTLPDLGEFEVALDTNVTVAAESEADVRTAAFKGDAPGASDLLHRAIAEGKTLRRAAFRVVWENIAWTVTVNGETLDVAGVKLPVAAPGGGAMQEYYKLRLETLESFLDLWDALFQYHLALRLDEKSWGEEVARLNAWLGEELG